MYVLISNEGCVILGSGSLRLRIAFITESIARITFTNGKPFQPGPSLIVTTQSTFTGYNLQENRTNFTISTPTIKLVIGKESGDISYFDQNGNILLGEPERGGKWLTGKKVYMSSSNKNTWLSNKQNINNGDIVDTARDVFEAKLEFVFTENEALFGLGSHEEGYSNLRGKSRQLFQHNRKIAIPYFVSTRGYGLLIDCCSLMAFHDDSLGSYMWADVVDELDYYFIYGGKFDNVTRGYHQLTGQAPLLPKYAFGFTLSKERYINATEMVTIIGEYRRRQVPVDTIVLDWHSWPGDLWGQKSFDSVRFPDPSAFLNALHGMNAHFMISIWPIMTNNGPNQQEMKQHGFMLGDGITYNPFLSGARELYWNQANTGLFVHGVDAWWCDSSEPYVADWSSGAVEPESYIRVVIDTQNFKQYIDPGLINVYSLLHTQGIYEGQRRTTSTKRVLNLTRSAYAGQHRYATVVWNGDICATWETYRRSIPEGVNFCASGEPYWTLDIGGFFLSYKSDTWFWHGNYADGCRGLSDGNIIEPDPQDTGCRDLGFWELYARWFQYGSFLPMFRTHGTDASREIWRFGEVGTPFYDNIAKYIRLRYQLMPYIYSLAGQVTQNSYTIMRPVAVDYPNDVNTFNLTDQYLFGSALMVCPVTTPMYYERNSQPIPDASKTRAVYLPAGNQWHDFWTETVYDGGQTITADAPLDTMPLFVPAGSMIPMTQVMQYVNEVPSAPYEIRIYRGEDSNFTIYEDAGDTYDYEQGAFALINLSWIENSGQLTIHDRQGAFPELIKERQYNIIFISKQGRETKNVVYTGQQIQVSAIENNSKTLFDN
jgi:alpha-D-xyloside xylohydrolase